jgi:hypothetical protein
MENTQMTQNLRACPDSEGLGYLSGKGIAIGNVSEVNGLDSAEIPYFAPTRHELIQSSIGRR